jgi:hypothetical protein
MHVLSLLELNRGYEIQTRGTKIEFQIEATAEKMGPKRDLPP